MQRTSKLLVLLFLVASLALIVLRALGDGVDFWQWRNPLPQGNDLLDVAYGNGICVAVGDKSTLLTSADGEAWVPYPLKTNSTAWFYAIAFGANKFVAVGNGIWTSGDGTNWVQRSEAQAWLHTIIFAEGKFVAAGNLGSILVSEDGLLWTNATSTTTEALNGLCFGNGKFVAAGGNYTNGVILTSVDGQNWITTVSGTNIFYAASYGNGQFVAVGNTFYGNSDVSFTSRDGVMWERRITKPKHFLKGLCFNQGLFIAAGSEGLFTSTDGVNWVNQYTESPNNLYSVKAIKDRLVAVGNAGTLLTSPDGTNWTRCTMGTVASLKGIAYGNDRFVVAGYSDTLLTSTNAAQWTTLSLGNNCYFEDMTFGNRRFVGLVSLGKTNAVFTSQDAITWSKTIEVSNCLFSATFGEGTFVVTGGNGTYGGGTILTSPEGQTWTRRSLEVTNALYASAYGNGIFVALGSKGTILSSSDGGVTWKRRGSVTIENLYAIAYGNEVFVAGGSPGHIFTSSDGIYWTDHQYSRGQAYPILRGITFGNNLFLALSGSDIFTSTNGIDWIRRSCPAGQSLNRALYVQNCFMVVGECGLLLQSGYVGAPTILNSGVIAEGFGFSVRGELGQRYRIQASADLDAI